MFSYESPLKSRRTIIYRRTSITQFFTKRAAVGITCLFLWILKYFQGSFFVELLGRTSVSDTCVLIINHWTVENTFFTEAAFLKVFLKISQNSQENILQNFSCSCSFLIKYSEPYQTSKIELFAKTAAEKLHFRCLTEF